MLLIGRKLRRNQRERGAAVVEAALIAPIFLLVLFGVIEISSYIFDVNAARNGARDGAREASTWASGSLADQNALLKARRSLGGMSKRVDAVIVFKATGPKTPVPPSCVTALQSGDAGVAGLCNIYRAVQVVNPDELNFGAPAENCAGVGQWDRCWPSITRNDVLTEVSRPDFVGVYVRARHKGVTGIIPQMTLTATSVIPIEAQRASGS